mgnify:CR=1 FL=1
MQHLLKVMDVVPEGIALVSLERGSKLYLDFVITRVVSSERIYVALSGGSGVYIVKADVVRELIKSGLSTHSRLMYFHWEDTEFALKLWLMGYKTASYEIDGYKHVGSTSRDKPLHRRYTEYLDPLMALIINVPSKFIILTFLTRFLRDLLKALRHGQIYLFLRAYIFVITKLKSLFIHRAFRLSIYKNIQSYRFCSINI